MRKAIDITREESEKVERLFYQYNSYMSMLEFLAPSISDTAVYDKKWDEASELWIKLDKAKTAIEAKYKPEGNWDRYEFDFDNVQVVFTKDEGP